MPACRAAHGEKFHVHGEAVFAPKKESTFRLLRHQGGAGSSSQAPENYYLSPPPSTVAAVWTKSTAAVTATIPREHRDGRPGLPQKYEGFRLQARPRGVQNLVPLEQALWHFGRTTQFT